MEKRLKMNKWITISLAGLIISTGLIVCLASGLADRQDMSNVYFIIAALVFFCLAWILSTGTLLYHIFQHCRESHTQRTETETNPRWTHYQLQTAPPLVPATLATPTASPLYDD